MNEDEGKDVNEDMNDDKDKVTDVWWVVKWWSEEGKGKWGRNKGWKEGRKNERIQGGKNNTAKKSKEGDE